MINLIIFALVVIGSVFLGLSVQSDPGYVLFAYKNITIETSLWVLIGSVCILILAVSFFVYYWMKTRHFLSDYHMHSQLKVQVAQVENSHAALRALATLDIRQLSKTSLTLPSDIQQFVGALLNLLKGKPMHLSENEPIQAQLNLYDALQSQTLPKIMPTHMNGLLGFWAIKTALAQKKIDTAQEILQKMQMAGFKDLEKIQKAELHIAYTKLDQIKDQGKLEVLQAEYDALPKNIRKQPQIVYLLAQLYHHQGQDGQAEKLIEAYQKNQHSDLLASLYTSLSFASPNQALDTVEKWLKRTPQSPVLLLCAGKLAQLCQSYGVAQQYFEKSLAQRTSAEAYRALGALFEKEGKENMALRAFKQGCSLANISDYCNKNYQ